MPAPIAINEFAARARAIAPGAARPGQGAGATASARALHRDIGRTAGPTAPKILGALADKGD